MKRRVYLLGCILLSTAWCVAVDMSCVSEQEGSQKSTQQQQAQVNQETAVAGLEDVDQSVSHSQEKLSDGQVIQLLLTQALPQMLGGFLISYKILIILKL